MMFLLNKIPKRLRWILSIASILLLILFLYRLYFFYHFKPFDKPLSGKAFLLGLRFDLRIAAILALAILIVSSFTSLNPFKRNSASKFWNIFLPIVFIVVFIFIAADFYHYDYLHQRLNASVLNYMQDAAISMNMMMQTYPVFKILISLILLIVLLCFICKWLLFYFITQNTTDTRRKSIHYTIAVLLFAICIFGRVGQYPLRWSDAFEFADDFKSNVALNPFQSFFSSLKFRDKSFDITKVKAAYLLMASYLDLPKADTNALNYERPILLNNTKGQPNVVLVICESFSAYKSSMYGNPLNTTPYFNELCKQGIFFERCFTPAYGTARGVWATLTGIPDVEPAGTTASRNPNAVNQHLLINDFKGYEKYYFLGGSASWANIRGLLTNNIDNLKLYEEGSYNAKKIDVWGISDKNLFLEANDILKKETKPFFTIIQTADNHRPYTIPKEDEAIFKKMSFPIDSLKKYGFESNEEMNAFRYTDFCFQQFIEAAKKEAYFNNTIFVFIGDHGIRGNAGSMFPKPWTEQGLTCEHVPLLFYAPAFLQPSRQHQVCSQVDVMPSIAALCNQQIRYSALGKNIFEPKWYNKQSFAFIIDPDINSIGILNNDYYYLKNLQSNKEQFLSLTNKEDDTLNLETDSIIIRDNKFYALKKLPLNDIKSNNSLSNDNMNYMRQLTNAYYETAKYLLLNNKKK